MDFRTRGGACKHIRAALALTSVLQQGGMKLPVLTLPASLSEALALRSRGLAALFPEVEQAQPITADAVAQTARAVEDMLLDDSASALEDRDSSSPDPEITADAPVPLDDPEPDPHDAFILVSDAPSPNREVLNFALSRPAAN